MGKINIQGLRALVKEVSTGLEEDWVVKALIAARLQRDFEVNGARKASRAANDVHWESTRFRPEGEYDAHLAYKAELNKKNLTTRRTVRKSIDGCW
jgi:hypothetical protein